MYATKHGAEPLTLCTLSQVATSTVAKLLALETLDSTKDIKLYINSPGKPHAR